MNIERWLPVIVGALFALVPVIAALTVFVAVAYIVLAVFLLRLLGSTLTVRRTQAGRVVVLKLAGASARTKLWWLVSNTIWLVLAILVFLLMPDSLVSLL